LSYSLDIEIFEVKTEVKTELRGDGMRPWDNEAMKILTDAHLEFLRGGAPRPPARRLPRRN
jgi:hypothetical protein